MSFMYFKLTPQEAEIVLNWFGDKEHNYSERGLQIEDEDLEVVKQLKTFLGEEVEEDLTLENE